MRVSTFLRVVLCAVAGLSAAAVSLADEVLDPASLPLPPVAPWHGDSESLIAPGDDPWITPAERSGLADSPSYAETLDWLARLVDASGRLASVEIGASHEGRPIRMVVASGDGSSTAEGVAANGRPTLLVHGGIHAGEIDGKDAGLMLLRDLTVGGRLPWLDRVNLLFVPVLNPDGHERRSAYARINQRGPSEMGWRTNARNQNLNRDFTKLDTPEVTALVRVIERWRPDLYIDLHVTDGIDYQYDITWGYNGGHAWSPAVAGWLDGVLSPALRSALETAGHTPGPLVFAVDRRDVGKGIYGWTAGPRFSNGYGDARHLATVLVENHSLKPYRRRVLGTYVLLETALATLATEADALGRATTADRGRRREQVALSWRVPEGEPETVEFLGVERRLQRSAISGGLRVVWTGEPDERTVPRLTPSEPGAEAALPVAYWVPAAWPEVIERLARHGLRMERTDAWRSVELELYRLIDPEVDPVPFEGRVRVSTELATERRVVELAPGSVRIPTDQPLATLAALLLEPASPDSFFQWGFFLEVLQRTEYAEGYVLEPLAERMLADDPELQREFEAKLLAEPEFAASARDRLHWFYERTPYYDDAWRLYPVGRELAAP